MANTEAQFKITEGKKRILIVEDEIINQEILNVSLSGTYDLITARSGEKALDFVRANYETISVILLDLHLPGISGIEILKQIKRNSVYSRIPVIVMTSDGDSEAECLSLGAIDFIPKPYPASKVILARILRTVELTESRDALRSTERDRLTGLYNKEFFYYYAAQFDLYHGDTPADAVFVDINSFHTFNDRYGKAYGDEVLKCIAEKAVGLTEKTGGIACRCEPDVFLFYFPHRTDYREIFDELSVVISDARFGENRIRLRIGVYCNVDKSLEIDRRFDRAKMAADSVRGNLADPIGYYDHSMLEAELLAEQLIDGFPSAIKEKQFVVYYQPKFDVSGAEPVLSGAEALVRWNHPDLGLISPGVFVPLFEKNGLIQTLDNYVWAEAASRVRDWKKRLGLSIPVSVNVSRVDLYDRDLMKKLLNIVKRTRIEPGDLVLEITESAYSDNPDRIIEKVKKLREIGFRIEMDDFGSGYSSLGLLTCLPIDAMKLDMQFIRNAFGKVKDTRLLEAMIRLADAFNLPAIAEGVETSEQASALKAMGCEMIQGYYFSRPLPADEFEAFASERLRPSV